MDFEYHVPASIIYGKGTSLKAATQAKALSLKNVLLVSDQFLEKIGVVKTLADALAADGLNVTIFTNINNEPTTIDVDNALKALKDNASDGIICLGGGSALDTAKAAAVLEDLGDFRNEAARFLGVLQDRIRTGSGT